MKAGGKDPGTSNTVIPGSFPWIPATKTQGLSDIPNERYKHIKANNIGVDVTSQILPRMK